MASTSLTDAQQTAIDRYFRGEISIDTLNEKFPDSHPLTSSNGSSSSEPGSTSSSEQEMSATAGDRSEPPLIETTEADGPTHGGFEGSLLGPRDDGLAGSAVLHGGGRVIDPSQGGEPVTVHTVEG